jgi:hypothetical protein
MNRLSTEQGNYAVSKTETTPCDDAAIMSLWRECGLPECFLGNGGTNHKLVAFADRIRSSTSR